MGNEGTGEQCPLGFDNFVHPGKIYVEENEVSENSCRISGIGR
jgi:hypothetical protein